MKKDKEQNGVKNDEKQIVSYIPRKCSATNRLITSKDHASVQISVADVDENGKLTGTSKTYNFCGFIRALGEIDDSLNRLATEDGYLESVWSGTSR
ncbi:30S ribosomal protein S21e [Glomus cerebriforme]|uniref:40S ribosomal protein S21 n=1 Tax=Glomus cerebriforme TaxID=658196 RepID=A0A397TA46_9GLOM|nr:30S ribosomal protein S21e [Glomus cerebriforme]